MYIHPFALILGAVFAAWGALDILIFILEDLFKNEKTQAPVTRNFFDSE
jgi:hypothetical protein